MEGGRDGGGGGEGVKGRGKWERDRTERGSVCVNVHMGEEYIPGSRRALKMKTVYK